MQLVELRAEDFRHFGELVFKTSDKVNLIYGDNASGKTSFLEIIYFLSRASSFRSHRASEVIQNSQNRCVIKADIEYSTRKSIQLKVEKTISGIQIKCNQEHVPTASNLINILSTFMLTPESHFIFTGTPKARRRWLDRAVFHMKPKFLEIWKTYHKALRQRNAGLKQSSPRQDISYWENRMCEEAQKIDELRKKYLNILEIYLLDIFSKKLGTILKGRPFIRYNRGWRKDEPLKKQLTNERTTDSDRGYTNVGPHRADITFYIDHQTAKKYLSRGQMKLYVAAIISGQLDQINRTTTELPIVLVDDTDAELDQYSCKCMLNLLTQTGAQCFMTTLERNLHQYLESPFSMFHVKPSGMTKISIN